MAGTFTTEAETLKQIKNKFNSLKIEIIDHKLYIEGDNTTVEAAKWWWDGFVSGINFQVLQANDPNLIAKKIKEI